MTAPPAKLAASDLSKTAPGSLLAAIAPARPLQSATLPAPVVGSGASQGGFVMANVISRRRDGSQGNSTNLMNSPWSALHRDVDRAFDHVLRGFFGLEGNDVSGIALDLTETADEIIVRAEVPGIAPDALELNLMSGVLTIAGQKSMEESAGELLYTERQYGSFRRSLQLPVPVDDRNVRAEHRNGVVTIRLSKAETAKPKRISVEAV
jgi:HSP20 family protein